eukprot:c2369_g1_i1 orf=220-2112(+)
MGHRRSRTVSTAVAVDLVYSPDLGQLRPGDSQRRSSSRVVNGEKTATRGEEGSMASTQRLRTRSAKLNACAEKENILQSASGLHVGQPLLDLGNGRVAEVGVPKKVPKKRNSSTTKSRSMSKRTKRLSPVLSSQPDDEFQSTGKRQNASIDVICIDDENETFAGKNETYLVQTGNIGQVEEEDILRELKPSESQVHAFEAQGQNEENNLPNSKVGNNTGESPARISPVVELQKSYEALYKKYQILKTKKYDEVEALYEEQGLRMSTYVKAAEAMIDCLKKENDSLKLQLQEADVPEILTRFRCLEKENAESRNNLVMEKAKNLELMQEVKRLQNLLLEHSSGMKNNFEKMDTSTQQEDSSISFLNVDGRSADVGGLNSTLVHHSSEVYRLEDVSCRDGVVLRTVSATENEDCAEVDLSSRMKYLHLNKDGMRISRELKSIHFNLYGEPNVQIVLSAVQKFNSSLMDALPSMLLHRLIRIMCTCTLYTFNETHREFIDTGHIAVEEPLLCMDLSLEIKKKDERIQALCSRVKLLQQLLECLLGLKLTFSNQAPVQLQLCHEPTGFSFKLMSTSDQVIANLCGEGGELLYKVVSLGTLQRKALDWMKEREVTFGVSQLQIFFKRLLRAAQGC